MLGSTQTIGQYFVKQQWLPEAINVFDTCDFIKFVVDLSCSVRYNTECGPGKVLLGFPIRNFSVLIARNSNLDPIDDKSPFNLKIKCQCKYFNATHLLNPLENYRRDVE